MGFTESLTCRDLSCFWVVTTSVLVRDAYIGNSPKDQNAFNDGIRDSFDGGYRCCF